MRGEESDARTGEPARDRVEVRRGASAIGAWESAGISASGETGAARSRSASLRRATRCPFLEAVAIDGGFRGPREKLAVIGGLAALSIRGMPEARG
jgi:hypothetical protein